MTRHTRRAGMLLAVMLVVGFVAAPTGGVSAANGAAPTNRTFALLEQPAYATLGTDVPMRLSITGPVAGLDVRATIHSAITSRTAFERTVNGERLGSTVATTSASADTLPVAPSGGRVFTLRLQNPNAPRDPSRLRIPVPRGTRTGVFPVEVELRNPDTGDRVAGFVTHLATVAPATDGAPLGEPLNVSWIWPITADPSTTPDGRVRGGFLAAIGADGRLSRLAAAASRSGDVPLTLVPGPETLEAWAQRAKTDPVANAGVLALRAAARTQQVLTSSYVQINLPSLERAGLGDEATLELNQGSVVLEDVLGRRLDPRTTDEAPLDTPALGRLELGGVDRVVVSPKALVPLATPPQFTPARPFTLANAGKQLAAYQTDDGLAGLLTGNGSPALRAAHFLGGLAVVASEQPNQTRGLVIAMPPHWNPEPALLDAVLAGLDNNPFVAPVTLDGLFAHVPLEQQRRSAPVVRQLAAVNPPAPTVNPAHFRATRDRMSAYKSTVPANDPLITAGDRALLLSLTSVWRGAVGRHISAERLDTIDAGIKGFSSLIETPPSGLTVTLTSRSADLPLSFNNKTGSEVRVQIRFDSDKLEFPSAPAEAGCAPNSTGFACTLPPRNTTIRFPVVTRASGTFPLQMTVTSEDGKLALGSARYTVRSTAVSGVGIFLTIGAGIFLAIWWVTHWRRSRRHPLRSATLAT